MLNTFFEISKKVIVITGASGQLGTFYSKSFLELGAYVVGIDISQSERSKMLSVNFPNQYLYLNANVTSREELKKALETVIDIFGSPDVLINNAALDSPPSSSSSENGPFEDYPESSWNQVLEVNLKGTFLCCQIFGAHMAKESKGSIINISSIYGIVSPDQSLYEYRRKDGDVFYKPIAYSASKSGLINLTKYLATYWAKSNVRVNTLTLGGVFNNQDQEFLDAYTKRIPIGRMAEEEDYIGPILFLCASASRYMTGANLIVDGGWTAI